MSSLELRRDFVIVVCAISAGIHGALVPAHFDEGAGAGLGFVAAAVLLTMLVLRLTLRPASMGVLAAAAAVLLGLLASYLLAVTTGVPVLHPEPEPLDGLALATKAIEAVGLVAAASLLHVRQDRVRRPIPLVLTALVACFSAFAALAVSNGHDAHTHSHASEHARG